MISRGVVFAAVLVGASIPSSAEQMIEVRQTSDPTATSAHEMFRFEPNLVRIEAGDTVRFVNSVGGHTVHAVPELWPEGVERVRISYRAEATFTFPREGVYGITCARHGHYGMVMLVVVGDRFGLDEFRLRVQNASISDVAKSSFIDVSGIFFNLLPELNR